MAGTRKLATSVEIGGTWYHAGTAESDISAEHAKQLTNPDVWSETDEVTAPVVVQEAPVFGLEPGDTPADQIDPKQAVPKKAAAPPVK